MNAEQNAREAMEVWRQSKLAFDFAVSLPPYTVEITPDQAAASVIAAKLAEKDAAHEATKAELQAITIALHDAIRRPMGVVPASADQFYNPVLAAQAEIRRIEKDAN